MSGFSVKRKKKLQERLRNETGNFIIKTKNKDGVTLFYAPDPIVSWGTMKEHAHRMPRDLAEVMKEYFDDVFPDDRHKIININQQQRRV